MKERIYKRILSICLVVAMICTSLYIGTGIETKAEDTTEYNELEITGFDRLDGTSLNAVYLTISNITAGPAGVGSTPQSVYGTWGSGFSGTVEFRLRNGTKKDVEVVQFYLVGSGLYVNWTQQNPTNQVTISDVARVTIKEGTILTYNGDDKVVAPIKITKTISFLKLDENDNTKDGYEVVPAEDETLLTGKTGKAKVILLSGQSNATGTSSVAWLKQNENVSAEDYEKYKAGYENVLIRYEVDSDNDTANPNIRLNASSTFVPVALGQGGRSNYFGPEVGIADYLTENYPDETFYIIKSSWSGTYLSSDWQEDGKAYTAFVERTNESFQILEDAGLEPELVAFCWMQGEADAMEQTLADAYYNNLSDFVTRVSTLYSEYIPSSGMAFIDAGISDMSDWAYHATVNAAKAKYAEEASNRYYLDTQAEGLSYANENSDLSHYDSDAMIRLGEMFGETVGEWLFEGPSRVELKTGTIDAMISPEAKKYNVYFSNPSALANETTCNWYYLIYNQLEGKETAYLTGKVTVDGTSKNAQIAVYGSKTNGEMQIYIYDGSYTAGTNFSIEAGSVFKDSTGVKQIQFARGYDFDVNNISVYPKDLVATELMLGRYAWDNGTNDPTPVYYGCDVSDVSWIPDTAASSPNDYPTVTGFVWVGDTMKPIKICFPGKSNEVFIYNRASATGITSGEFTIKKDTVFVSSDGTYGVTFPKDYMVDVTNQIVTHEQDTVELNTIWYDSTNKRFNTTVAQTKEEMQKSYWFASSKSSSMNEAVGVGINEDGEEVDIKIEIHPDNQLFIYHDGVADEYIKLSKGTVFTFTSKNNMNVKANLTFKLASNYKLDVTNKTIIHQETLEFEGFNWKSKDIVNVENGASSFNELEWYQKIQDMESDREIIKATGIAKDYAGNDVNVTIQIQNQNLITCDYDNVKDTRITIPAGTTFKTTTVSTAQGTKLTKQYEFTFTEDCELDAATKYVGPVDGQTGTQGDANADSVVGVADLVRMKRFVNAMVDSTVTSINGWQVGYGADVNVDGSYNVNDIQPLKTVLLTGSYAVSSVLVANGATDYSIVTFNTPSDNEIFAAEELQYFIKESTNVTIPIIKEIETTEDGKYIYIGETSAAEAVGVAPTFDEVQYNGFQIATEKQNIYIRGYSELGTRNGVYQFLEDNFDYECYAAYEIGLTSKDRVAIAADYDKVVVPSFDWRQANYGEMVYENGEITNTTLSKRMRFNHADEIFVTGHSYHNSFQLIRPDTYYEAHPDWFYTKDGETEPTQLCYSKAITDDAMFTVFFDNVKKCINENNVPNMMVGIQDLHGWCDCEGCTDSYNTYQAHSAIVIQFVNKLQVAVNEWYATAYPGKQPTRLVFFAYHDTINPPVKTGDAAKDALITLNENSGVMFAPSGAKIDESYASQETVTEQLAGWKQVTDNVYMWTYSLIMDNALLFVDTIDFMIPNYQLWSGNGVSFILDQTEHYQQNGNSGFSRLKMYLMSKLQWNCNITETELEVLIDDFFENYFGEAATVMKALYEAESGKLKTIYQTFNGNMGGDLVSADYWSQDDLASYLSSIDQAYNAIAELETSDPERYEQLYERILLESMQFRYLMLSLYPAYYGEGLQNARTQFQTDFETLKLTRLAESTKTDRELKEKMDFYLTETLPVELSTGAFSIWEDETVALSIANHSSLSSNTDSIYCTATVWTQFYGNIIVDGDKVEDARFDIPPLSQNTKGVLAMRNQTSFATIQIPAGAELRTADGLYKIVFDKTYIINYTNKTVTTQ